MVPAKGRFAFAAYRGDGHAPTWVLWLAAVAILFGASTVVGAAENFARVTLPQGVSIDLPKNWVVLSNNQRITLDTAVEAGLDLSGVEQETSDLPFAANYYDDRGNVVAILNIRYYSDLNLSQADARSASSQDIQELDAAIKENLLKGMETFGMSITSWNGTSKAAINGIVTFITEYSRASLHSPRDFRGKLIRVFAEDRSFTLTASYLDSAAIILRPITDRIIASKAYWRFPSDKWGIRTSFFHIRPQWEALALGRACVGNCHVGNRPGPAPRNTVRLHALPDWQSRGDWLGSIVLDLQYSSVHGSGEPEQVSWRFGVGRLSVICNPEERLKEGGRSKGVVSCGNDIAPGKKHV